MAFPSFQHPNFPANPPLVIPKKTSEGSNGNSEISINDLRPKQKPRTQGTKPENPLTKIILSILEMAFFQIIVHFLIAILCAYLSLRRNLVIFEQRIQPLSNFSSPLSTKNSLLSPSGFRRWPNNSLSSSSRLRFTRDPRWPIHPILLSVKNFDQTLETGNSSSSSGQIEYDFYRDSCPKAEQIVRTVVDDLYRARPEVAPALLRLLFHDCFIQGCDASVLLDSTEEMTSEKESPSNESLRGFGLIDIIKSKLEEQCPGVVSCADILVLAARDCVALSGGPYHPVYTGRREINVAFLDRATAELPNPCDHLPVLLASFASKGFDGREIFSLFGAHSIGVIHCKFFEKRLYRFEGNHNPDPSLDLGFQDLMRARCNNSDPESSQGPETYSKRVLNSSSEELGLIPMNYEGPAFGTQHYQSLLQGKGILYADQQLMTMEETDNWVRAYASDASLFCQDFALVMIKLSNHEVLTAPMGQIRLSCSKVA